MTRGSALVITLLSFALASCGGGGGADAGAPGSYQPMAVGDYWLYETFENSLHVADPDVYHQKQSVTGTQDFAGTPVLIHEFSRLETGAVTDVAFATATRTGITQYFLAVPDAPPASPPLQILRFPLVSGESYIIRESLNNDLGFDLDSDGQNESITLRTIVTVGNEEGITVPAGTYGKALRVTTTNYRMVNYSAATVPGSPDKLQEVTEWMVQGIGTVESYTIDYQQMRIESRRLVAYSVGGRVSDTRPPAVSETKPGSSVTNNTWSKVSVRFNEQINYYELDNADFTLRDAQDQPVSGTLYVNYFEMVFTPSAPLPSGTYTATITGVTDRVGNVIRPYTWQFTVDTSLAGDPQNHLPMAIGNRWIYKVTENIANTSDDPVSQQSETITGIQTIGGTTGYVYRSVDIGTQAELGETILAKTDTAILELFAPGHEPPGLGDRRMRLRLPFDQPDCSYPILNLQNQETGMDFDNDGVNDTRSLYAAGCSQQAPSITVPAGTFPATRYTSTSLSQTINAATGTWQARNSTIEEWLAPGVGVVRRRITSYGSGQPSREFIYELTTYRVGSLSNDITPPAVSTRQPATTTNSRSGLISASFNEQLDLSRLNEAQFTVVDANGSSVSGSLGAASQQLTFTPATALADGTYTVTVRNVYDLLGNKLPVYSWSFTVDATPPAVTAASPANGATGVSTSRRISIDFNEAMQGLKNAAVTVQPFLAYDQLSSIDGKTLVLWPHLRLQHGTTYTVTVGSNVSDVFGNTLTAPYSFSFSTTPAKLAFTTPYSTQVKVEAIAIGDVTGDGRNDVVAVTSTAQSMGSQNPNSLFIFSQNTDGTLATPAVFPTNLTDACAPTSVALGDITGDGQTDIVIGENSCGLKIFERAGDGSWPVPARISAAETQRLRIGDLNNDGRLDIAGIGDLSNSNIAVWYQQSTGGLGAAVTYGITNAPLTDIELGDVNSDGLADIVAVSSSAGPFGLNGIAVLTRSGSGGFNAPTYFGTGDMRDTPRGVALGDLNGDGRRDIVVSFGQFNPASKIGVLYQSADGTLATPSILGSDNTPGGIEVADINRDGRDDVIVKHDLWNAVGVYVQDSNGQLAEEDLYSPWTQALNPQSLAAGDFNGDGHADIVVGDTFRLYFLGNVAP